MKDSSNKDASYGINTVGVQTEVYRPRANEDKG
jgi:hypothetical protein